MRGSGFTDEQIIGALREADAGASTGSAPSCREASAMLETRATSLVSWCCWSAPCCWRG